MELVQTNLLVYAVVALAALLVAWWLLRRGTKTAPRAHKPDVLDEGQAPAQRNQALIDAAPAAQIIPPPPLAGTMAGIGEVVAVAAQDVVEEVAAREQEVAPPPPPPPPPEEVPQPAPEVVLEPEPTPQPVPEPSPAPEPTATEADDLSRIKGLGPKLQTLLPTLGITSFAQIAAWTEEDLARIDPQLGPFAGRPARDNWIEQAKHLAAGDVAGFEDKFGKV